MTDLIYSPKIVLLVIDGTRDPISQFSCCNYIIKFFGKYKQSTGVKKSLLKQVLHHYILNCLDCYIKRRHFNKQLVEIELGERI